MILAHLIEYKLIELKKNVFVYSMHLLIFIFINYKIHIILDLKFYKTLHIFFALVIYIYFNKIKHLSLILIINI